MNQEAIDAKNHLIATIQKAANLATELAVNSTMKALEGSSTGFKSFEAFCENEQKETEAKVKEAFPDKQGEGWFWFLYEQIGEKVAGAALEFFVQEKIK